MEDKDLIDFNEARPAGLSSLKLPAFWMDKPVSCFVLVKSHFRLHSINRDKTRYDYLVLALTKEAISLILDVVEHPPEHHPYTALKQSMLNSHQMTDFQKITTLVAGSPQSCWPLCWSSVLKAIKHLFSSHICSRRDFVQS
jgi:hypothetical protein